MFEGYKEDQVESYAYSTRLYRLDKPIDLLGRFEGQELEVEPTSSTQVFDHTVYSKVTVYPESEGELPYVDEDAETLIYYEHTAQYNGGELNL